MTAFNNNHAKYQVRTDLNEQFKDYWQSLARPGTWWTGVERVAIAAETRAARDCEFCTTIKSSLSPYSAQGEHETSDQTAATLDPVLVDLIHRIVRDPSRLTDKYVSDAAAAGFTKEHLIELIGVSCSMVAIDDLHFSLGFNLEPLPAPQGGATSNYKLEDKRLEHDVAFMPLLKKNENKGKEADMWGKMANNIIRGLSLVPNAQREFKALSQSLYLDIKDVGQLGKVKNRSIRRTQMEFIASRVSAVNECFY